MKTPVKCKNCLLKWVRVTIQCEPLEATENLQYNCPRCGSNWFEEIPSEQLKEASMRFFEYIFIILALIFWGVWLASFFVSYFEPDRLGYLGVALGNTALAWLTSIERRMKGG